MIFLEIICFEFPCIDGAHFPKVGGSFSQSRWLIFPKSVAHFPKVGGSFSQSRRLIFPKSVADFPKTEPVLQKPNRFFTKTGASFFCSNKASLSLKRSLCCCFNLGQSHAVQKDKNTRKKNCIPQFLQIFLRFSI